MTKPKETRATLALAMLRRRLLALANPDDASCAVDRAAKVKVSPFLSSWVLPIVEALQAREIGGDEGRRKAWLLETAATEENRARMRERQAAEQPVVDVLRQQNAGNP